MGDRKRKGHALNARGDRFITALSDLFEKERMGNLKLVHLSPLYLLLVLDGGLKWPPYSTSSCIPEKLVVSPDTEVWKGRRRDVWHVLWHDNWLNRQKKCENLFDFSRAFYPGPWGKLLIKPVNMNISRMGNRARGMTMMSVGRLGCSLEGG